MAASASFSVSFAVGHLCFEDVLQTGVLFEVVQHLLDLVFWHTVTILLGALPCVASPIGIGGLNVHFVAVALCHLDVLSHLP
jgi:hypothetical protein